MKIGIVIGQVVSTRKNERLEGCKLMITQPITPQKEPYGEAFVAVDTVGAGVGETILYVRGSVAARAMRDSLTPVDTTIVGIIDRIDLYDKERGLN